MFSAPTSIAELRQHSKLTVWMLRRPSKDYKSCSANCTGSTNPNAEAARRGFRCRPIPIQIFWELVVHDNFAVIAGRGSVHEMQNAVARAQCQAHMRSRMEPVSLARNHANDVAAAQFRLDAGDLAFWNFIKRPRRHIRFHSRKRPEQRAIRSKITIMPPAAVISRAECGTLRPPSWRVISLTKPRRSLS
jgi:hypothetical protein